MGWRAGLGRGDDDLGEDDDEVQVEVRRVVVVLCGCAAVAAISSNVLKKVNVGGGKEM